MGRIGVVKIAKGTVFPCCEFRGVYGGLPSITSSLHRDPLASTEVGQAERNMIPSFNGCCHIDAILGTPTGDSGGTSREGIVEF